MVFTGLDQKPELIVFDLDYTLWPFDCDDYYGSKLFGKGNQVFDETHSPITPFPQTEAVLRRIKSEPGMKLAVASMTSSPKVGHKLLKLYGWDEYFDYLEIYPTSKTKHFKELTSKSNIPYERMMFFDDLSYNVRQIGNLGVHAVQVYNGIDMTLLRKALMAYSQNQSR